MCFNNKRFGIHSLLSYNEPFHVYQQNMLCVTGVSLILHMYNKKFYINIIFQLYYKTKRFYIQSLLSLNEPFHSY